MRRYKYFICERDLIDIGHGKMEHITWYTKRPKECQVPNCDNSILEVIINVTNPIKSDKNKSKSIKQPVVNSSKKR